MRVAKAGYLIIFLLALPAFGQSFHFGVEGGIPVTQYFETGYLVSDTDSSATRRYTVGAAVEFGITNAFSLEVDAMYHRLGYVGTTYVSGPSSAEITRFNTHGNSWDVPVLVKYHFTTLPLRPFVAGGGVVRFLGPVSESSNLIFAFPPVPVTSFRTNAPPDLEKRVYPGVTAGGGADFRLSRLHFLPELRWTHWTANISGPGGLLRFPSNQVEFLLGVRF